MILADLRLLVRYVPAKLFRLSQRVTVQVGFGVGLMLVSFSGWPDEMASARMYQAGTFICTISLGWWAKHQGQRRIDPETKTPVRNPTLRMTPEEVGRIQKLLRK